jgi:hypothetical protein
MLYIMGGSNDGEYRGQRGSYEDRCAYNARWLSFASMGMRHG